MQASIQYIYTSIMRSKIALAAFSCFLFSSAVAQDTTKKQQSIDITSSYKPILRNAVKINFSGSQLAVDTTKPTFNYVVPSQNLFYAYQPISLRPLALTQDSTIYLGNRKYIKAGFGSYNTPYLNAGVSFGDGKTSLINITAKYIGSKGKDIKYQDYSQLEVKGAGSYFAKGHEIYAAASYSQDKYYLYGYDHQLFPSVSKGDILNQFQDINISGGAKNTVKNELGINYNPNININFFNNKEKVNETTINIDLPAEKALNEDFKFKVALNADLTKYSTVGYIPNNFSFNNNLVKISPSFEYKAEMIKLSAGAIPTWNNGEFSVLPNIQAEVQIQDQIFAVQAGWVGRYVKNTFRNLSQINPYIAPLTNQFNTKEMEYYGGIKATLGKHFNFSAKAGLVQYTDILLFINDTNSVWRENNFLAVRDSKAKNFRIHGDVSYINQDKFSFTAGLNLNGYTNFQNNAKPWHTIPMEFTSSLRWWAFEKFMLKGDMYLFGGSKYIEKGGGYKTTKGGTDLSIGAEYQINKQFSVWLDANNLFNDKYERWHNYQVYGLNLVGGILIRF